MVKQVEKVRAGLETVHEELLKVKAGLEEEIRKAFEEKTERIDKMLAECVVVEEVEVEDEPTETTEENQETVEAY